MCCFQFHILIRVTSLRVQIVFVTKIVQLNQRNVQRFNIQSSIDNQWYKVLSFRDTSSNRNYNTINWRPRETSMSKGSFKVISRPERQWMSIQLKLVNLHG